MSTRKRFEEDVDVVRQISQNRTGTIRNSIKDGEEGWKYWVEFEDGENRWVLDADLMYERRIA